MSSSTRQAPIRVTIRALAVTLLALSAITLTYRLRPSMPPANAAPATDIASACGWLAWALLGYLEVAVAATALGHVATGLGLGGRFLLHLAPANLRHLVDLAVTVTLAGTVLGTSALPAGAATASQASRVRAPGSTPHAALDWPGLSDRRPTDGTKPATPLPSRPDGSHGAARAAHRHHPKVGLVVGGAHPNPHPAGGDDRVVVQAGDSLWKIAARHLGPNASAQSTAIAWQQWYAANRDVVGDDPDLIYPGQRLRPPATAAVSTLTGSAR